MVIVSIAYRPVNYEPGIIGGSSKILRYNEGNAFNYLNIDKLRSHFRSAALRKTIALRFFPMIAVLGCK